MRFALFALTALLTALGTPAAFAAHIEPLSAPLSPAPANAPILTLQALNKPPVSLTLAQIERLPMHQTTLKTDFGMAGTFQGVLLTDLLKAYGLDGTSKITVVASDDYEIAIPQSDIQASPALVATRLGGKPLIDPSKGPLILLWPELEKQTLAGKLDSTEWVWSIVKIRSRP